MASNYPPGVTGNEYVIAGPDYEGSRLVAGEPTQEPCGECSGEGVVP